MKKLLSAMLMCSAMALVTSCENQSFNDEKIDVDRVHVEQLSADLIKVRDYVPQYAVVAHRGTTFWAPEETEASFRWARETGADYLEADLQVSKDGVVLALHDDNLRRTTNIDVVFGELLPTKIRHAYYVKLGYTDAEATAKVAADRANFQPYRPAFYTYEELLMLDAGTWFNEDNPGQARPGFTTTKQYITALEDLIAIARGKIAVRDTDGYRVVKSMTKTDEIITSLSGKAAIVKYEFEYQNDPQDTGHRPGIYIEFKEPWLNPQGFEQLVYDELARLDMNIIESPEPENTPFWVNKKVNVGNTNGKVILQTFSLESLKRIGEIYQGKMPMCFLLWRGSGATDLTYDDPVGYASFINLGVANKAHFMGPSIAGAPNNYPELNRPWQAHLIRRAGMKSHPYSFDDYKQMAQHFGEFNFGNESPTIFKAPYLDAMFTNRTEMSLEYVITKKFRTDPESFVEIPNPADLLKRLGY